MNVFFVFTYATRDVRENSGLVGWRDPLVFVTRTEAKFRRLDLKAGPPKEQRSRALRRVIKSERLP